MDNLYERLINNGGFTIDNGANEYNGAGYVVALPNEVTVTADVLTAILLRSIVDALFDFDAADFVGAWCDNDGRYCFSPTMVVDDRDDAIWYARHYGQATIWDVERGEPIFVEYT